MHAMMDPTTTTTTSSSSRSIWKQVAENPYVFGVSAFASLGGFVFGYDQGVVSGVLRMESFAAQFPRIQSDSGFRGWFVSTLLLAAWLGSLVNGALADRFGRRSSMLIAVVVFVVGSAMQAAAASIALLFAGRAVAGFAVGMLTMIVPMYMSEVSTTEIRGTLVVLQQRDITLGIFVSYWLEYGTQYIGGVRCAPDIPYTGGTPSRPAFDPLNDAGDRLGDLCPGGQSQAAWRVPFALQIAPALILGIGMLLFYPESPRFHLMRGRDDAALRSLARLRRASHPDSPRIRDEYLAIKAEVLFDQSVARDRYPGKTGAALYLAQYKSLFSTKPDLHRLAIGVLMCFFQQFVGCNAIIYFAPTIFSQLGLPGNATSLLATGVYGVVNTLSTLPALFCIDRIGRRPLLLAGCAGTFVSLVVVGTIAAVYGEAISNHPKAGWVAIAFIYIYDVNFSYSIGPISWVLPSEIFNLGNRSKAMAITTSAAWMSNFIIGLVTPDMLESLRWGTYIFFAAFALAAFAFTYFFVPETKGKSLEDMDEIFGDTAAHEEKQRLISIAASLGLTSSHSTVEKTGVERTNAQKHA